MSKNRKKIILFAVIIIAIELSGHGILTSILRFLGSLN